MKILSYPKKIIPGHKLSFILRELEIPHTNDINDPDITHILHQDYQNVNTVSQEVLDLNLPIINKGCLNVKKDYVDEVFTKVFGYSLFLDPTKHRGCCVEKSSQQAIHNGRIIQCPTERDTNDYFSKTGLIHNRTYQKLVDTRFEMDKLREFRVPIIRNEIPLIFVKELGIKSCFHPFPQNYYKVYSAKIEDWFSQDEISKMIEFSNQFSFDFAEIDVLRDNSTDLIYIVDVNNIPASSLFNGLDNKEECIKILANQFKKLL